MAQATVDKCMAMTSFATAWPCLEGTPANAQSPHSAGHAGVGGQMDNGVSSPGDPIFWMHHAWLDKLFWDWQAKDKTKRLKEIGGNNIGPDYAPAFPPRPASIP
jgi:tyrosinase